MIGVCCLRQRHPSAEVGDLKRREIAGSVKEPLVRASIVHGSTALEMPKYGMIVIGDGEGSRPRWQEREYCEEKAETGVKKREMALSLGKG